jgi:hypothetical protein
MKDFHFYQAYKIASIADEAADEFFFYSEIPWDEHSVLECLTSPSKISILHWYIYRVIYVTTSEEYRDADFSELEDIKKLEKVFNTYKVELQSFRKFRAAYRSRDNDLSELFYQWFESEHDSFTLLWELLTDEVHHILFGNRNFLLKFNSTLAEFLEEGNVKLPTSFLNGHGKLKRCSYLPKWLRKAIYFRDQGRCVFCQRDLSGLLSTDRRLHFDHMVPLYLWGTNDPSNFQLLCESCNLKKSKKSGATSNKYPPWWEE